MKGLTLQVLGQNFMVCRLEKDASVPAWATGSELFSITRTPDELSIVCQDQSASEEIKCEHGWKALKVAGPLDFSLTGILSSLAGPLAIAGVSIFAISTYDTDYILVKQKDLPKATEVLSNEGHIIA